MPSSEQDRLDPSEAPILDALRAVLANPIAGFGGPGHHLGHGAPPDALELLGEPVFRADVLTPKGLDDRTESAGILQRAWALAAKAWGGAICRFSTGGSTQGVQTALAACAAPGDTVLVATNAHKAEWLTAVFGGLDVQPLPVAFDPVRQIEHGVDPATLESRLRALPHCKAVLVVSPTFYGVTSDIAALAKLCHARGLPLIADAAWGGAFPFCSALPPYPLSEGADIAVSSVHKTMGALAQAAIMVAGPRMDPGRFGLAYDMFQTTSPSVPLLLGIDALRRRHVLHGEAIWTAVLEKARHVRREAAAIPGLAAPGPEALTGRPGAVALDETKVLVDVSGLGCTGFQADAWMAETHRVSILLSDARYILATFSVGTSDEDVARLLDALRALPGAVRQNPKRFHPAEPAALDPACLSLDQAMPASRAFHGSTETVKLSDAEGRIAAEIVAPAPPEIPRLRPGQRITAAHIAYLEAQLRAGAFIADPAGHGPGLVRVVADAA